MADTKITALTAISTVDPAVDVLPIVDVSDTTMAASGTTKKITSNQILGAGGTATLASATITGDLTVDTNTLYVKSSTNQVGIGTTSPNANFTLDLTSSNDARARQWFADVALVGTGDLSTGFQIRTLGTGTNGLKIANAGNTVEWLRIDSTGVHTWQNVGGVAGTAMTLNSTGLGVGQPATTSKLEVGIINTSTAGLIEANALKIENSNATVNNAAGLFLSQSGTAGCGIAAIATSRTAGSRTSDLALYYYNQSTSSSPIEGLRLNSSGNVGVGVTPNTWTAYKALQINTVSAIGGSSGSTDVGLNWYYNGGNKYIGNGYASSYIQYNGTHIFNIAANNVSGAGAALNWTPAMTLDTSGNLLVGTTSSSETSSVGHKINTSLTAPWLATVGSASTNSNVTSSVYSTGAAAYRFYVGYGGTVFATNTTISAISDARLKENVQDIDVGLGAILALKPRKFDWKEGKGKNIKGDRGFIAQEFEAVFPQLVDEWKDNAPEGEAPYKSVRQDLIPVLVKAIQELTARVEALEA